MQWLYNLKTQRKMLILNILLAVNLFWISGAALLKLGAVNKVAEEIYTKHLVQVAGLESVTTQLGQMEAARQRVAAGMDADAREKAAAEFDKEVKDVNKAVAAVKTTLVGEDAAEFGKVGDNLAALLRDEQAIVRSMVQNGHTSAMDAMATSLNIRASSVAATLDKLVAKVQEEAAKTYDGSKGTYQSALWGQIWIMLFGIVINVLMGIFIAGLITKPLNKIVATAESVAQGDLTQTADVHSRDEIGAAANALNLAIENLRGLILQVSRTAEQVATSSEQLAASASETGKTTSQVASTIEQLAKGTEEQSKSAALADETTGQMMGLLRGVTERLQAMVTESNRASELANSGRQSADKSVDQMTSISETVSSSAQVVKGLGERSREIGQIVDVITGIADQTNLLALNAAIEAARAGEQGRGFAVVAEEVRKLAEQSRQAAEQIAGLIREIQTETGKAVSSMEAGTKEVAAGTAVIGETGRAFQEIAAAVETVVKRIHEVTDSAVQVTQGAEQVVQAVENIANITEEAAASAEEVSAGAEEQTASVQQIAASSDALARMAQELQSEVAKFKL
ncbi:MAG: methyl-accepting chemotaxis protein [Chitinophagales bacterium]